MNSRVEIYCNKPTFHIIVDNAFLVFWQTISVLALEVQPCFHLLLAWHGFAHSRHYLAITIRNFNLKYFYSLADV